MTVRQLQLLAIALIFGILPGCAAVSERVPPQAAAGGISVPASGSCAVIRIRQIESEYEIEIPFDLSFSGDADDGKPSSYRPFERLERALMPYLAITPVLEDDSGWAYRVTMLDSGGETLGRLYLSEERLSAGGEAGNAAPVYRAVDAVYAAATAGSITLTDLKNSTAQVVISTSSRQDEFLAHMCDSEYFFLRGGLLRVVAGNGAVPPPDMSIEQGYRAMLKNQYADESFVLVPQGVLYRELLFADNAIFKQAETLYRDHFAAQCS